MKLTAETTLRTDRVTIFAEWMMLTYAAISMVCSSAGWPWPPLFWSCSIEVPQVPSAHRQKNRRTHTA